MGLANLAYGTFSFSLARRAVRPRALLQLLASANIAWGVLCAVAAPKDVGSGGSRSSASSYRMPRFSVHRSFSR